MFPTITTRHVSEGLSFCVSLDVPANPSLTLRVMIITPRSDRIHHPESSNSATSKAPCWGERQFFPPERPCHVGHMLKRCWSHPILLSEALRKKPAVADATAGSLKARSTGLEPAASNVTGWRSNQLSYDPSLALRQLQRSEHYCYLIVFSRRPPLKNRPESQRLV